MTTKKPTAFEAMMERARPREATAVVYLAGDIVADIERLERHLAEAGDGTWTPLSMADSDPTREIAEQIATARERLRESAQEFRFRALPDWSDDPDVKTWSDLLAEHPGADDQLFNPKTFPAAVISACCIEPAMTVEQVRRLFGVLNQAQRNDLFNAAYDVNTEGTQVPFSVNASAILASLTGEK